MTALERHLSRRSRKGFTLIELLTVIAIIAVLAGLVVGMASGAKTARVSARAQADLRKLQTSIEAYKADRNSYPPDHLLPAGSPRRVDPVVNPLYYELRGMEVSGSVFKCKGEADTLSVDAIRSIFGRRGFLNASADPSEPAQTYFDPKASEVKRARIGSELVELLVTPFDVLPGSVDAGLVDENGRPFRVSTWRYVSTSPTNNTGSFDLWTDVKVGKEIKVFKNW